MGTSKKKKTVAKKVGIKKKVVKKAAPSRVKAKKTGSTKKTAPKGLKKEYLKSRNICRVTFWLPKKAAPTASKISLVGEFNNWDSNFNIMKKLKNGDFSITLDLIPGKEYHFRYLTNDSQWINDENADRHESNPYGGDNSVIIL